MNYTSPILNTVISDARSEIKNAKIYLFCQNWSVSAEVLLGWGKYREFFLNMQKTKLCMCTGKVFSVARGRGVRPPSQICQRSTFCYKRGLMRGLKVRFLPQSGLKMGFMRGVRSKRSTFWGSTPSKIEISEYPFLRGLNLTWIIQIRWTSRNLFQRHLFVNKT